MDMDDSALGGAPAAVQSLHENLAGDSTTSSSALPPPPPPHQTLSPRAREIIKTLDSRSFGFLDFQQTSTASDGDQTSFITKEFIRQGINQLQEDLSTGPQTNSFRGEVFCQLGHLHLLLEEYREALSAYQHFQTWCPESATHTPFLYGLGLIYFHFNAHKWATEAFQKVLELAPNFARVNEIHLRLGVMCKMKGANSTGLQHFQKALSIPGPSSLSKFEIQFHIGHLFHLGGQFLAARKTFEEILMAKSVPSDIKAMALRQLGWLYHTNPEVAHATENPQNKAIELLKLAVGADPTSGQTWYFLGRCHAAQGRAHEAFMAYQQAVNKSSDDQANTWCSIGVLYHNMGQPRDSLQSYLCAVYLDPTHISSWTDLGCLYESVGQPIDALICYKNAVSAKQKSKLKYKSLEYIFTRIMSLEQYATLLGPTVVNQHRSLPSVHEAWYSLIPQHIRSKNPRPDTPMLQLPGLQNMSAPTFSSLPNFATLPLPPLPSNGLGNHLNGPALKRQRILRNKDPIILRNMNDNWLRGLNPVPSPLPSTSPFSPMFTTSPGSIPPTGMGMNLAQSPRMGNAGGLDGTFNPKLMPQMEPEEFNAGSGMGIRPGRMQNLGDGMGGNHLITKGQGPNFINTAGNDLNTFRTKPVLSTGQPRHVHDLLNNLHSNPTSPGFAPPNSPYIESELGAPIPRDSDLQHLIASLEAPDEIPTPIQRPANLGMLPLKRKSSHLSSPPDPLHNDVTSNQNHLTGFHPSSISTPHTSTSDRHVSHTPTISPSLSQKSDLTSDHSTGTTPTAPHQPRHPLDQALFPDARLHDISPNHSLGTLAPPRPPSSSSVIHHFQPGESCSITLMPRQNYTHPDRNFTTGQHHVPSDLPAVPTTPLNTLPSSTSILQFQPPLSTSHNIRPMLPPSYSSLFKDRGQLPPPPPYSQHPLSPISNIPSDLPGDLSSITPLDFGSEVSRMDDYLQQYLTEGQESTNRGTEKEVKGLCIKRERVFSSSESFPSPKTPSRTSLFAGSPKPVQKRSNIGSPSSVLSPLSPSLPTLLSSPLLSSPHSIEKIDNTAWTGQHVPRQLTSPFQQCHTPFSPLVGSPTKNNTSLRISPPENATDTGGISDGSSSSSGVSSARTKLSTNSGSSSPTDSSGIVASSPKIMQRSYPSPLCLKESRFNYPVPDEKEPEFDTESEPDLLSPIHEPFPQLQEEGEYMAQDPELRPPDPPKHSADIDLNPKVQIYEVSSKEDALSETLHAFCTNPSYHICMIRGIAPALGLDLDMFSTKALVSTCGDHEMEVREQIPQAADENWDVGGRRQVWRCESSKSQTTIREYAGYQRKVLLEEKEESSTSGTDSDGDQKKKKKLLHFGTNVDLSDEDKWREQLKELEKLPNFLKVLCPEGNFLAHIGHTILGMNSVQLYMKVPGSRTPGHQENNNCCSVNINIGPGDCEWFAVPNKYWGVVHNLCEKHRLSFLVGSWWPILEELREQNVPVYRFTQYEGDIVWINPGTVHWVQANSVCNNIAWNIGPLTAHQFRLSWERYQWNKIQRVRSIVPMIHLTWNLARRVKIKDVTLYQQIRSLLESSLVQTHRLMTHLESANIPVLWHGRAQGEPAPCCNNCLEEVFNILFVLSHKGEYLVYCHKCAGGMRKSFTVLQQYTTEELEAVLASFKLRKPEMT